MRIARASSASMTTASSGSRSRRKLTTQSLQAAVCRSAQQSQSIVRSPTGSLSVDTKSIGSPWSDVTSENSMILAVSLEVGMSLPLSVGANHAEGV